MILLQDDAILVSCYSSLCSDCRVSPGDPPSDSKFLRLLYLQDVLSECGLRTCAHLVVCARP